MYPDDPINMLMREHEQGLANLEQLYAAAQDIGTRGFSPQKFLEIIDSIHRVELDIRTHTDREEKYLYPFIDRHDPLPSRDLVEEHRELVKVIIRIRQSIEDIEEGRIYATTVKELLHAISQLHQLMCNHITKENQVLFPLARKLLSPEEFNQVTQNFVRFAQV